MSEKMEIERKFLIDIPDTKNLFVKKEMDIIQTYLSSGKNNSQRRVRKITENNSDKYFYTEKIFISPVVRDEKESEISQQKYNELLKDRCIDVAPVTKKRICFDYQKQLFEMDIYPFSSELAILELELENQSQEIFFPDCINVIKEVSDDKRYSNASLATAGTFPSEAK